MHRVESPQEGLSVFFQDLMKGLPSRFTLGQFLEAAEQRSLPAQQSYAYLQALKRVGSVEDDGFWFTKRQS